MAVEAHWNIELNCDCPKCENYVDLLDCADFWDGRRLEVAEHDTERSKDVEVTCPVCGHEFLVDTYF